MSDADSDMEGDPFIEEWRLFPEGRANRKLVRRPPCPIRLTEPERRMYRGTSRLPHCGPCPAKPAHQSLPQRRRAFMGAPCH